MRWMILAAVITLTALGCGDESEWATEESNGIDDPAEELTAGDPDAAESDDLPIGEQTDDLIVNPLLRFSPLPAGAVIGACYPNPNDCGRFDLSAAQVVHIGDMGQAAGRGWSVVQYIGDALASTRTLHLPAGVACGFTKRARPGNCFGFDPNAACPAGWLRRTANDARGTNWAWCAYANPNRLVAARLRPGLTAFYDTDSVSGGPRSCPAGFTRRLGPFDMGRAAGHGLVACIVP